MPRPKKDKSNEVTKCPLCGQNMPVEYSCNMESFSGRASWHLDFRPRIIMCGDCSKELLISINSWYKKRNKTNNYDKF